MEYIKVTKDNIESEHICCAISNNKDVQVASKKAWLTARFSVQKRCGICSSILYVLNSLCQFFALAF